MKSEPIGKYTDKDFDRLLSHLDIPDNWDDYEKKCWECDYLSKTCGYCQIGLNGRMIGAHRFMCVYDNNGYNPLHLDVCHSCNNKSCCSPFHLRFDTHRNNQIDSVKAGNHPHAKVMDKVKEIRDLYATGFTRKELGERFGVHKSSIVDIVTRKHYDWID